MAIKVDAIEYPPGSGTYQSIGSTTDYQGMFIDDDPYGGLGGLLIERTIAGRSGQFDGLNIAPRRLPLSFVRKTTSGSISSTTFNTNIVKWFAPGARNSSGKTTRYLRCTWHDGTTTVRVPVNVVSIQARPQHIDVVDIVVQATWPYLENTTAESPATWGGAAITNDGNVNAPILLTFTASTGQSPPGNFARYDITETAGIGGTNLPVLLDWGSAGVGSPSQFYVYDQYGVSIPWTVDTSRYIWTTVSIGPSETVSYYVVSGTGFSNPLANTLDWGEFYTANTSNTSQEQDGFLLSSNPARTGLWTPHRLAFVGGGASSWGYQMTEGATSCVFTLYDSSDKGKNDANGMVIVTGIPADTITGLSRVTANHTSNVRSYVRYRQAGQAHWTDSDWIATTSTTATGTITVTDAVEFACGIEPSGASPTDAATLTLSGTGTPDITINLDTALDLTVTKAISATTDAVVLDGTVTNSTTGQSITLTDVVYYDAVSGTSIILYIDFRHDATKRIYSADTTNGVVLIPENGISFSDPISGMVLAPGDNTTTDDITPAITATWRDTYG